MELVEGKMRLSTFINFNNNPENKYIWYQCVPTVMRYGYNCYEIDKNNYIQKPNSTLTFVNKNIPRFLHRPIIFIDMLPDIKIHRTSHQT